VTNLNDPERLKAVAVAKRDSSPADNRLDRITQLVSHSLRVPISLVSIVDEQGQFFRSACGLAEPWASTRGTPLSHSFCQHVVTSEKALRISDAREHPLVKENLAITELNCIAYIGVPLRSQTGEVLGSLCAIDTQPRTWTDKDEAILDDFRALVEDQLAVSISQKRLRDILNTIPQMVWSTLPDGYHDFYNDRWYDFTGVPHGSTDGEAWNEMFHPADRDRAWRNWRHSLSTGEPYEIEYRLRDRNGDYRWTLGRALPIRDEDNKIERWFGTCTDINDLKAAEEALDMVSRELSHRIQNIFAVVNGLITLAARSKPESERFAKDISERLRSLAKANTYVRSDRGASVLSVTPELQTYAGLIETVLAPYQQSAAIDLTGGNSYLSDAVTTPLALILHEFATNAVKYGALSNCSGRLSVEVTTSSNATCIFWKETGGPQITSVPPTLGFGSVLVTSMAKAMRADIKRTWAIDGLGVSISIPN
jgi:PAS domain S-box-containing protein